MHNAVAITLESCLLKLCAYILTHRRSPLGSSSSSLTVSAADVCSHTRDYLVRCSLSEPTRQVSMQIIHWFFCCYVIGTEKHADRTDDNNAICPCYGCALGDCPKMAGHGSYTRRIDRYALYWVPCVTTDLTPLVSYTSPWSDDLVCFCVCLQIKWLIGSKVDLGPTSCG